MQKTADCFRLLGSAVLVPVVARLLMFASEVVYRLYHRAELSIIQLDIWYFVVVVLMGACVFWVASRAVGSKKYDTAALSVGFALCVFFALRLGNDLFYDFGLLFSLLTVSYFLGLVVSLRGRLLA